MTKEPVINRNTSNQKLLDWVDEMTRLCQPEEIFWCDGSEKEYNQLCELMVKNGTFIKLNEKKRPGCFLARSHPSDVARVEDRNAVVLEVLERETHLHCAGLRRAEDVLAARHRAFARRVELDEHVRERVPHELHHRSPTRARRM